MNEATMTDADMKQREKIVKSMKKKFKDFRNRYGAKAKNVIYATATKMAMKESVKDEADKGEYDYEGDMAKSSLRTIVRNAQMMHDMLGEDTNLPEWVASKITLAEDYIVSAAQYMQSEITEEVKLDENLGRGNNRFSNSGSTSAGSYKSLFRPPTGFTKKGIEKGGGVKTTYHYKGKSNTPSGATMKMGGVSVPLGKAPTKRRPKGVKEEVVVYRKKEN